MNGISLSPRDRAIAYLYGIKDGTWLGGKFPYPYCDIAQTWMSKNRVDGLLRSMRRISPEGNIDTAFEFPERLFSPYAIEQVGFKACLKDIVISACRTCIFSNTLPDISTPTLRVDDGSIEEKVIDLSDAAQAYLVEWHNQDHPGEHLCNTCVRQVAYSYVDFSRQNKGAREAHGNFPAIVISANPQLEPLMYDPNVPLDHIVNVDFRLGNLKAGTHHRGKR